MHELRALLVALGQPTQPGCSISICGLQENSLQHIECKLRLFLPLEEILGAITPQRAAKLYLNETERIGRFGRVRAASHQKQLRLTKAFFAWTM